jgi:hypothetical protein
MNKILVRKNFQEIIEFCTTRRMGDTIKEKVDDWVAAYKESNTNMLLHLMEEIEIVKPVIELEEDFHKEDILSFDEYESTNNKKQIEYLYSYIVYLSEKEANVEVVPSKEVTLQEGKVPERLQENDGFKTVLSKVQLKTLFDWLVNKQIISPMDFENFFSIFSDNAIATAHPKVIWLLSHKNHLTYYKALHLLMRELSPESFERRDRYFQKVQKFFMTSDSKGISVSALRRSFYKDSGGSSVLQLKPRDMTSVCQEIYYKIQEVRSNKNMPS